jgi:two-component system, OmpR family, sensor histidine kinase SenX3
MGRRKTAIFFLVLGISLTLIAAALNIGWILLNLREVALLVFGVIFFAIIITGLILNTIFLVREIRRNERHDAFLNAVTHELKTPIASIKLYLETLKSRNLDEAKRQEFYDIMLADNERLLTTVEQVLQASRTRDKQRAMNLGEVDLRQLINDTVKLFTGRLHLDDSVVRFSEPTEPVKVLGDRAELETVILNLLDNAIKYSNGEPKISIRLRSYGGSRAEIYVRDNGKGIARANLKRIFKRFYRVPEKGVDPAKGTGLGLAIVRSIMEKHGGQIRAESKGEGKGTTFVLHLPTI